MSDPRDVEVECWKVYDGLDGEGQDVAALRLKSLELVVKIRSAGGKVKPEALEGDADTVRRARERKA